MHSLYWSCNYSETSEFFAPLIFCILLFFAKILGARIFPNVFLIKKDLWFFATLVFCKLLFFASNLRSEMQNHLQNFARIRVSELKRSRGAMNASKLHCLKHLRVIFRSDLIPRKANSEGLPKQLAFFKTTQRASLWGIGGSKHKISNGLQPGDKP